MAIKAAPSLKARGNSGSGDQRPRPVIGSFVNFTDNNNTAAIRVIAPSSKMDGKLAHVSYADLAPELAAKRLPLAERVPGKTERVKNPVTKEMVEVPLKTDWNPGMVVKFEGALFTGEGNGDDATPYQMSARWGGTYSSDPSRVVSADFGYVVKNEGRNGGEDKYRVVLPYVDQSQVVGVGDIAGAADSIADQVRAAVEAGESKNIGLTVVTFDKEGEGSVALIGSFMSFVDKDGKSELVVKPGSETLAEAFKKAKIDPTKIDQALLIPQITLNVTGTRFMEDDQVEAWDRLAKYSMDKNGDYVSRAQVITMSPDHRYVGITTPIGSAKNYIEKAMVHTGLLEADQTNDKGHETMPDEHEDQGSGPRMDNYND